MAIQKDKYDVVIIGSGIGGLVSGNILAKNGFKVVILEKNHCPGGAVTTFYKDGYPIDISHSLGAMRKGAITRKLLDYLGIYSQFTFREFEKAFVYVSGHMKRPVLCYADPKRFEQELKAIFPAEAQRINRLFSEIDITWNKEVIRSYYNPSLLRLSAYPVIFPHLVKYRNHTAEQILNIFTNNAGLKDVFSSGWPYLGLDRFSASGLYMICLLGAYYWDRGYFVKGGFGRVAEVLADNFNKLGGEIIYNSEVQEILISKNTASGVRMKDGLTYSGKTVISNADSKKTFLNLIRGNPLSAKKTDAVKKLRLSCSAVQVHLAVEADIDKDFLSSGSVVLPCKQDMEVGFKNRLKKYSPLRQKPVLLIGIADYQDFSSLENGEYLLNIIYMPSDYYLWQKLKAEYGDSAYQEEKENFAQAVIAEIKEVFSIKRVSFKNVFTPLSFEKWMGATEGAVYDLAFSPEQILLNRLKHKSPVKNLYLVGAKTFPGGGIIGSLCSGVALSDILLSGRLTNGKFVLN